LTSSLVRYREVSPLLERRALRSRIYNRHGPTDVQSSSHLNFHHTSPSIADFGSYTSTTNQSQPCTSIFSMQSSKALLLFAAAASALDIRLHANYGCNSASLGCSNISPNVCCDGGDRRYGSLGFHAIPRDWRIRVFAFIGGTCNNQVDRSPEVHQETDFCMAGKL